MLSSKYSQVKDAIVNRRAALQSAKRRRTQCPNLRFSRRTHPDPVYLLEYVGMHMGTMVLQGVKSFTGFVPRLRELASRKSGLH